MKPLRNLKKIIFILLLILYSVGLAQAGEQITLSPDSGHSNQNPINEALKNGDVFLNAGIYEIDGPIYTYPGRKLTLDQNAIIRVWKGSSQFFTGRTGLINCVGSPKNIEISGGEIDGNCDELPSNYHSNDQDPHDCERAIFLIGSSGDYGENIYIHDIKIYDTFSDGIHVRFSTKVKISNVFESNCEHEGIYFCVVLDGLIYNCEIAGITSDNLRIENSKRIKVDKCLLYSYTGNHNNGAYKGGEAGIQIGDQGRSFGTGSDKSVHTSDIEICNTIFANNGRTAVALDIAGKEPSDNVYFHDNQFIGASKLETMGIPVEGFDFGNMPTKEMSEKIFSSIFDILDVKFTNTGRTNQTSEEIPYTIQETEQGRIAGGIKIIGFKDLIYIDGVPYIPGNDSVLVKYEAVKAPSFSWNNTGVSKIDKDVNIKLENGNATATLTVKMDWYKLSTDSTGASKKKHKTSEAVFSDTVEAPQVLNGPSELKGTLYEYPIHSLAYVPSDGLTQIEYDYDGKTVKHVFLLGEQHVNEKGIVYTNFSNVNYWKGDLDHQGEFLFVNGSFDPEKLTVTVYTPYESFQVTHFDYVKKDYPVKFYADWLFPSFGLFLVLWLVAWYYIRKILY